MRDGELTVAAGKSRSGKTHLTAKAVNGEPRLLVWDAMGEFADRFRCRTVPDAAALHRIASGAMDGRYSCAWPVSPVNFDRFCRLAWVWLRACADDARPVALVVEELADVSAPGKAPVAWGEIVRKSLRFGPHIYALTQRPAESDKTVIGNATIIRCHAMKRVNDRRAMALDMGIDQALIDGLDFDKYQWIELNDRTHALRTGGKGLSTRIIAQTSKA